MAYSSWSVVFGEQPSAAKWNILGTNDASFNDGTGIAGLYKNLLTVDSNPYKFRVYRNSAWTIGALAKLSFDTEEFDTNNNVSSGVYTAPVSGFYQFNTNIGVSGNTSRIFIAFYKNASTELARNDTNISNAVPQPFSCALSTLVQLTAGDTVEVQTSGTAAQAGQTGSAPTSFSGFLVSKT